MPLAILFAIPVMIAIGFIMERGLIKHFYKRPHADQILVTFGLAKTLPRRQQHPCLDHAGTVET